MERQLFDKTLPELREAFVRARFAEPAMFGRADVNEWLAGLQPNEPWNDHWLWSNQRLIEAVAAQNDNERANMRTALLANAATSVGWFPVTLFGGPTHATAESIFRAMRRGKKVYYSLRAGIAVVTTGNTYRTFTQTEKFGEVTIRPTTDRDVYDILIEEHMQERPKAAKALAWIRQQCTAAIQSVRAAAERDFDEAVAVSADGTKIVKAGWVIAVEVERDGRAWLFPASAFHAQKIRRRRDSEFGRRDILAAIALDLDNQRHLLTASDPTDAFLTDTRHAIMRASYDRQRSSQHQILITVANDIIPGIGSVLVTNVNDCPSPLPAGGRKLN